MSVVIGTLAAVAIIGAIAYVFITRESVTPTVLGAAAAAFY